MSKIAFFSIPAKGHINPTLEIVRELTSQGHTVRYYTHNPFAETVKSAGAEFFSLDEYDRSVKLTSADSARVVNDLAFSVKVLVNMVLSLEEPILADLRAFSPDCIVYDSMAIWGKLLAEKLGIPHICSTATFVFNRESAKIMPQSFGSAVKFFFALPAVKRNLKRLQKRGYPISDPLSILQNDNAVKTLCYTSREFQPAADSFENVTFCGPILRLPHAPSRRSVKKTVYISLGSVLNNNPDFYKNCIEAFVGTNYKVIISAGENTDLSLLGTIPENISVYRTVNQLEMLTVSDLFITHCGMNSVNESVYFGVPMIFFPQTAEEEGVARRAGELGCGELLNGTSPREILEKTDLVLGNTSYKNAAESLARGFRAAGGAKTACDAILNYK